MRRLVFWSLLASSLAVNLAIGVQVLRARMNTMPLMRLLDLTSEQRATILDLRTAFLSYRAENTRKTSELRGELGRLLTADAPDRAAVDDVLRRIGEQQAALQRRVVEQALAVRAVLTPEQRPAFEALMQRHLRAGVPMQQPAPDDLHEDQP